LPAGISAPLGDGASGEFHDGVDTLGQHLLLGGDTGADGEGDIQAVVLQTQHAHVQGGLRQSGEVHAHSLHALRQCQQRVQHEIGRDLADGGGHLGLTTGQGNAVVAAGIFVFQGGVEFRNKCFKLSLFSGRDGHRRIAAGADHIVELTAGQRRQPQTMKTLHGAVQHPAHLLIGAGAAQMDVRAGVAALQAGERNGIAAHAVHRLHSAGQMAVRPQTARAGHCEYALHLGVQIQQLSALQIGAVQCESAVHAHLLVHSEHRLDGRMGQRVVRQNGQDHGHGDAVVAAQRGLVGPHPFAVGPQVKSLGSHILGTVVGLGADHVDMALQDDGHGALIACGSVLPDNDVVAGLLPVTQAQFLGEAHTHIADDLGVAAAVRHGAELFKILEYLFRLQSG